MFSLEEQEKENRNLLHSLNLVSSRTNEYQHAVQEITVLFLFLF